jgi:hypothetical protein
MTVVKDGGWRRQGGLGGLQWRCPRPPPILQLKRAEVEDGVQRWWLGF